MNAGGVDKACKSNGNIWDYINFVLVANEVVIHRNSPQSREQLRESVANTRWSRKGKDLSLLDRPARYQLVGKVMAYQGNDA